MAKQLNVNLAFTADTSQAKAQIQNLQQSLTELTQTPIKMPQMALSKDIDKSISKVNDLKFALESATNKATGRLDLNKFNKNLALAGTNIQEQAKYMASFGTAGEQSFSKLSKAILQAEVPLRRTNGRMQEFATTMKNTIRWQLSSSMLHGAMGMVHQAMGYAKDLNESLNNIRIVTGQSTDQMARFAKQANISAKALDTTTTKYTNASLIYYQQGLSSKEVKERTDTTIKMANVARESATVVSDQMTAIWNNFNKGGLKPTEYYADVITALGAATASSTSEISQGLNKFAGIADTVGLSYEYATSALATVTATTRQSADVVGTAFKTMFARMQGLKLGETLDDGTTLNKYSEALQSVGVNIKGANGEIKNMDTILDEMADKWQTLSKDEQIALAQTVAGTRQYTQLVALMSNWDFMEENLKTVKESSGTLQKQADIYSESWEASSHKVKASFEDLFDSVLSDKFFISLNSGFSKFLNLLTKTVDGLGGMKGTIFLLGGMLTKMFNKDLAQGLRNIGYNLRSLIPGGEKKILEEANKTRASVVNSMQHFYDANPKEAYKGTLLAGQGSVQAAYMQKQSALLRNNQTLSELDSFRAQQALQDLEQRSNAIIEETKEYEKLNSARSLVESQARGRQQAAGLNEPGNETKFKYSINGQEKENNYVRATKEVNQQSFEAGITEQISKMITGAFKNSMPQTTKELESMIGNAQKTVSALNARGIHLSSNNPVLKLIKDFTTGTAPINLNNRMKEFFASVAENTQEAQDNATSMTHQAREAGIKINEEAHETGYTAGTKMGQIAGNTAGFQNASGRYTKMIDDMQGVKPDAATAAIAMAQGLQSSIVAASTLASLFDKISNKEFDNVTDVAGSINAVIMQLPMLLYSFKALSGIVGSAGSAGILGLFTAMATAIQLGAKFLDENSFQGKFDKITGATSSLKENAKEISNDLNNLFDNTKRYEDSIKSLDQLTKGTQEFKDNLKMANDSAAEIINTLDLVMGKDYQIGSDGRIEIDVKSDEFQEKTYQKEEEAEQSQAIANGAEQVEKAAFANMQIHDFTEQFVLGAKLLPEAFQHFNDTTIAFKQGIIDRAKDYQEEGLNFEQLTPERQKQILWGFANELFLPEEIANDKTAMKNGEMHRNAFWNTLNDGTNLYDLSNYIKASREADQAPEFDNNLMLSMLNNEEFFSESAYKNAIIGSLKAAYEKNPYADDTRLSDPHEVDKMFSDFLINTGNYVKRQGKFYEKDAEGNISEEESDVNNLDYMQKVKILTPMLKYESLETQGEALAQELDNITSHLSKDDKKIANALLNSNFNDLDDWMLDLIKNGNLTDLISDSNFFDFLKENFDVSQIQEWNKNASGYANNGSSIETFSDISKQKNILFNKQVGDVISADDYNTLLSLNNHWKDAFIKTADGTYRLTQTQEEIASEITEIEQKATSRANELKKSIIKGANAKALSQDLFGNDIDWKHLNLGQEFNGPQEGDLPGLQYQESAEELFRRALSDTELRNEISNSGVLDKWMAGESNSYADAYHNELNPDRKLNMLFDAYQNYEELEQQEQQLYEDKKIDKKTYDDKMSYIAEKKNEIQEVASEMGQIISDFIVKGIEEGSKTSEEMLSTVDSISDLKEKRNAGLISEEDYDKSFDAIAAEEVKREGFNQDSFDNYRQMAFEMAENLQIDEYGNKISNLKDVSEEASQAISELALRLMKLDRGLDNLAKNEKSLTKLFSTIKDSGSRNSFLNQLNPILKDIFNIDPKKFSDTVKTSQEFFNSLKNLKKGDLKGFNDIQKMFNEDFFNNDDVLKNLDMNVRKSFEDMADFSGEAGEEITGDLKDNYIDGLQAIEDALVEAGRGDEVQGIIDNLNRLNSVSFDDAANSVQGMADAYNSSMDSMAGNEPQVATASVSAENPGLETEEGDSHDVGINDSTHITDYTTSTTVTSGQGYVQYLTKNGKSTMTHTGEKAGKPGGGGGGGGGKPKKVKVTRKSDKMKRYHEIDDKLDTNKRQYKELNDLTDRLYGKHRIQNMEDVNKKLTEEIELNRIKYKEANEYLSKDRKQLLEDAAAMEVDVKFGENGDILNWTEIQNELLDKQIAFEKEINERGGATEADTEKLNEMKEKYDNLEKSVNKYDETKELKQDLREQMKEAQRQIEDQNAEALSLKLELKLEVNEDELKLIDYYIKKIDDDFYKMAEGAALLKDKVFKDNSGTFGPILQNMKDLQDQSDALTEAFTNEDKNKRISESDYAEGMKEIKEKMLDSLSTLVDLDKEMTEYYSNTLSAAGEELGKFTGRMEKQTSALQHFYSIMELTGKQTDYKALGENLKAQGDAMKNEMDIARQSYEMYAQEAEKWKTAMDSSQEGTKEHDIAKKNWEAAIEAQDEAYDTMLSKTEAYLEQIQVILENKFKELNEEFVDGLVSLTPFGSLEEMNNQIDRGNSLQEDYLTTTNKIYETTKLMRTAQNAIDETTNKIAKDKYKQFIEETKMLQEQGQMSKFELDIQKAKYELLVAEIALQEAQEAKSQVRLSRDSEGNFSYVYTADQDKVAEAQQKVDDANNNIYNIALEGSNEFAAKYKDILNEVSETQNDLREQFLNGDITEEEYEKLSQQAEKYYSQKMKDLTDLYSIGFDADGRIVDGITAENQVLMEKAGNIFKEGTPEYETWKNLFNKDRTGSLGAFGEWRDSVSKDNIKIDPKEEAKKVSEANKELTKATSDLIENGIKPELQAIGDVVTQYGKLRDSIASVIAEYEKYVKDSDTHMNENIDKEHQKREDEKIDELLDDYFKPEEIEKPKPEKDNNNGSNGGNPSGPSSKDDSPEENPETPNRFQGQFTYTVYELNEDGEIIPIQKTKTYSANSSFDFKFEKNKASREALREQSVAFKKIKYNDYKNDTENYYDKNGQKIDRQIIEKKEAEERFVQEQNNAIKSNESNIDKYKLLLQDPTKSQDEIDKINEKLLAEQNALDANRQALKYHQSQVDKYNNQFGNIMTGKKYYNYKIAEAQTDSSVPLMTADEVERILWQNEYFAQKKEIEDKAKADLEEKRKAQKSDQDIIKDYNDASVNQGIGGGDMGIKAKDAEEAANLYYARLNYYQKYGKPAPFNTGGYTGEWGPEGRLAVLHEKEIVLNKEDTANIFKIVSLTDSILKAIDLNAMQASLGFGSLAPAGFQNMDNGTLEQNVTIHAEFPNVSNSSEIEEAFDNLINQASQYANRK